MQKNIDTVAAEDSGGYSSYSDYSEEETDSDDEEEEEENDNIDGDALKRKK